MDCCFILTAAVMSNCYIAIDLHIAYMQCNHSNAFQLLMEIRSLYQEYVSMAFTYERSNKDTCWCVLTQKLCPCKAGDCVTSLFIRLQLVCFCLPGMWTTVVLRSASRPKSHGLTMATLPDSTTHRSKSGSGGLNVPTTAVKTGRYKIINDLPGPSLATTAYWLFVKGYANKSHVMQVEKLIAQVIRQEGRYPARTDLPHWKEYRDLRGQAYGLHVE
ncbi:uncharacterized protein LOC118223732 isoform X1 [Anguilla anguilla]|uniref:uncharacterized protein LOC118223732 isoform X1 n=1 Tax=Anguilla anguilla TaxID=7936 RepID=UPI0015AA6EE1|nr:uncharacterized protein LOC118223732 isoform X1 [Anguilla anguilla]